jgi:hypothetical protein
MLSVLPDGKKLTPFITVKKYIPMEKLLGGIIFKSNEEMWVTKNLLVTRQSEI